MTQRALSEVAAESLASDPWFSSLPKRLQKAALSRFRFLDLPRDAVVYASGDPKSGIYCVLRGSMHMLHFDNDGRHRFFYLFERGDWFGVFSAIDGVPQRQTSICSADTLLAHLPQSSFEELLRDYPAFGSDIARLITYYARILMRMVGESNTMTTAERLAKIILSLGEKGSPALSSAGSRISQEKFAAMVGVSRQSINKILQSWKSKGIIDIQYGHVIVKAKAPFRRIAENKKTRM